MLDQLTSSSLCSSPNFLHCLQSNAARNIFSRYIDRPKSVKRAHIGEGPCFAQFNYHSPIHNPQETTVHRMLISTPLSPNPHRNLLWSDNALFPIWKKERKSISGFNTRGSQSILSPSSLSLRNTLTLQFSLHLWQMVNRNNGVWLLGGQDAAGGENKAADESAWAGITEASMALTSRWNGGIQWRPKRQRQTLAWKHVHVFIFAGLGLIEKLQKSFPWQLWPDLFLYMFIAAWQEKASN